MDDDRFVHAFEACTLPNEMFHHLEHIRLAWIYLRSMDFDAACERLSAGILRFATHHGVLGKYHATITIAWMCLVRNALATNSRAEGFDRFLNAHPELANPQALERFYSPEALASEEAREQWTLPDRQPIPGCSTSAT